MPRFNTVNDYMNEADLALDEAKAALERSGGGSFETADFWNKRAQVLSTLALTLATRQSYQDSMLSPPTID